MEINKKEFERTMSFDGYQTNPDYYNHFINRLDASTIISDIKQFVFDNVEAFGKVVSQYQSDGPNRDVLCPDIYKIDPFVRQCLDIWIRTEDYESYYESYEWD